MKTNASNPHRCSEGIEVKQVMSDEEPDTRKNIAQKEDDVAAMSPKMR